MRMQNTLAFATALLMSASLSACAKTAALDSDSGEVNVQTAQTHSHHGADAAKDHSHAAGDKYGHSHAISHDKSGAAVSLSSKQSFAVAAGAIGEVVIEVQDGYRAGTLTLEANDGDVVQIYGATRIHRADMASDNPHIWKLQFSASEDGVHYIPIIATAEPQDSMKTQRALAVRVDVGDIEAAKAQQNTAMQTLPDGEKAVVMQAEETIK